MLWSVQHRLESEAGRTCDGDCRLCSSPFCTTVTPPLGWGPIVIWEDDDTLLEFTGSLQHVALYILSTPPYLTNLMDLPCE